jgi:hypothetical protein|tara:strand:- start:1112 stop:1327 length:216 start_codon:yes stop_codon:yes gene_type:complete
MNERQYTAEMGFILGDAITEFEEVAVLDAMADESEMTEEVIDDWYATLLDRELAREQRELWSSFWNDKERN